MKTLNELFTVKIKDNQLTAEIWYNEKAEVDLEEVRFTKEQLKDFLKEKQVTFGFIENNLEKVVESTSVDDFPIQVARGIPQKNGENGDIKYELELNPTIERTERVDFREVMKIPSVKAGEKLATLIPPTKGNPGTTVRGTSIKPKPGKPYLMRPGRNVRFNQDDQSFYATENGEVHVSNNRIHVHNVYEINSDITMKIGNIDFVGNVVIRGNVPSGFTIKAAGDIKIFGIVEAATIIAGGSVYISEGIAGLKTGSIEAKEDVQIGYINQANVYARGSIYVDHSILHSQCVAENDIICHKGNIIGGSTSAGNKIEVRDLGNRMHTKTYITFGVDQQLASEISRLEKEQATLKENIKKLNVLEQKLTANKENNDPKTRITLLRLKNSKVKAEEQIEELEDEISRINATIGNIELARLHVRGTVYPNVIVAFGKYQRTMNKEYDHVLIRIDQNEIVISPY